jgi:hypothetical protein
VKPGEGPPQNSSDLIKKAFMQCCECKESLLEVSKRVYYCEKSSPDLEQA